MPGYAPSHLIPLIDQSIREATAAGVMMETAGDGDYSGRYVEVDGAKLLNFGGCSYLGLDQRQELKEGAIAAVRRYGTQFSISRAYLQSPLYEKLESALDTMTGGHALVTPSTTLAHIAALPVLVRPGDAVLIDRFTHASVHTSAGLLGSVPVVSVAHGNLPALERAISRLEAKHEHVWYLLDGLYSMFGDFAPLREIAALLAKHPKLHLYVDDAHSTSWLGTHGRGWALEALPDRSRVVVALSLNKAFSAAGGALIFASEETRGLVRRCGGPMLFSGPIQPPMLGAAVASAELHLTPELPQLQAKLRERIELVQSLARELGVVFVTDDASPIFYVRCGTLESMYPLARALRARDLYVCPSGFPAVPKDEAGIRFTVSLHNSEGDIRRLMEALATEVAQRRQADAASGTVRVSPASDKRKITG